MALDLPLQAFSRLNNVALFPIVLTHGKSVVRPFVRHGGPALGEDSWSVDVEMGSELIGESLGA